MQGRPLELLQASRAGGAAGHERAQDVAPGVAVVRLAGFEDRGEQD